MAPRFLRPGRSLRRLARKREGSVAVEFALLLWPTIMLLMGAIQLAVYQYTQVTLSNALFDTAADPETSVLSGDQAGYKTMVCGRIRIMPTSTCTSRLLVEMAPIATFTTAAQPIQGTTFSAGASMNLLVLRATIPVLSLLPLLPTISAKGSVVFRRA